MSESFPPAPPDESISTFLLTERVHANNIYDDDDSDDDVDAARTASCRLLLGLRQHLPATANAAKERAVLTTAMAMMYPPKYAGTGSRLSVSSAKDEVPE